MSVDLRGRLTLTVPEAGELLGIGRDAAYAAAERGDIPCQTVGRRKVVPTHSLLKQNAGWPDDLISRALGIDVGQPPQDTEADSSREPATATIHVLGAKTGDRSHGAPTPH